MTNKTSSLLFSNEFRNDIVVKWGPGSDKKGGGRGIKEREFLEIQFYE